MGYTTNFTGGFDITPKLRGEDLTFLTRLSETRRMKRKVDEKKYGVEGEFFVEETEDRGQNHTADIIDYNTPPKTQPGLWLQWAPNEDGGRLEWNGGEKFYEYVAWLEYLIEKIFKPRGYTLNGKVEWEGEESSDLGKIIVKDNEVTVKKGRVVYD